MSNYGRIDGVWFDIFGERLNTSSKWTAVGFQKMFGVPFDQATGAQLAEFNARTLAGYLDEVRPIADEHQPRLRVHLQRCRQCDVGLGRVEQVGRPAAGLRQR